MPGPTALVTLTDVHNHLNIPTADTSHDTELQGFIDAAQPVVEDVVGPVVNVTLDEWYDGGGMFLSVRHRPIVSVTSVTEYIGTSTYTLTQCATPDLGTTYSYSFETSGQIVRRSAGGGMRAFPDGTSNVRVVYVAGRATVPANIRMGTLEVIRHNYQLGQQGGRPAFGGGAEDVAWTPSGFAIPTRAIEWLTPNRRHPSIA